MSNESNDLCYPILTPFKHHGFVVKPPAFIQLTVEEAEPLITAGVISGDGALPMLEAFDSGIQVEEIHGNTTTESSRQVAATPAGGAPPAGTGKTTRPARVIRKTASRKSKA